MNYAKLYRDEPEYIKVESTDADWAVWRQDDEKRIYVRFKDTSSAKDVYIDLLFYTSKIEAFDGADWKVHAGFKKAYYSCRDAVLNKCYELYQDGDEFLLLGHSLGGAMAMIAAEDIGWHFKKKVRCITWGAPRVTTQKKGILAIGQYLTDDSINFEVGNDIVPKIPFWFKKLPKTVIVGDKFNLWETIKEVFHRLQIYHISYSNDSIYYQNLS